MSTVNDKLTAIADNIRNCASLHGTKLSLDGMAEGVMAVYRNSLEEGRVAGYCEGFDKGKASVQEVHKLYVSGPVASGTYTFLEGNKFVIDNREKDGFLVQIVNLEVEANGVTQLGYGYCGNKTILPSGDTGYSYGCSVYRNGTSSGVNFGTQNVYKTETAYGVPKVTAEGNVTVVCHSTRAVLTDGFYLVILSVAEV